MRKILEYGFIAVVICFTSCNVDGDKYDGIEVVNRETGEIYTLRYNRGDVYFVYPKMKPVIDTSYCR